MTTNKNESDSSGQSNKDSPSKSTRSNESTESTESTGEGDEELPRADYKREIEGLDDDVRQYLKTKNLDVLSFIAKGSFASVYKCKLGDQLYAVKAVSLDYEDKERENIEVNNEKNIAKTIQHKNVIRTHMFFELEKRFIFFVQDFADGGDLITIIEKNDPLLDSQTKKWFVEIVTGVNYLHQNGFAHRDIKADNILLRKDHLNSNELTAKVTDFGFSQYCLDENKRVKSVTDYVGTVEYSSPENLLWKLEEGEPFDPFLSDSFSLGIVLYLMIALRFPFPLKKRPKTKPEVRRYFNRIYENKWKKLKVIRENKNLYDLIDRLLEAATERRLRCPDIINHPWCKPTEPVRSAGPDN